MLRFIALILMLSIVGNAQSVHAQTDDAVAVEPATGEEQTTTLECFDYYSPRAITTYFEAKPTQSAPNEPIQFSGAVTNGQPLPLVDVTLHAKVFKRNEVAAQLGRGDTLITQAVVKEGVDIPARGSAQATYEWLVPANAEGGSYYAVFYATAAGSDLPIMGYRVYDDVIPGQVDFEVVHDDFQPVVTFDRTRFTLNNQPYSVDEPPQIEQRVPAEISVTVVNPANVAKVVTLQWNTFTPHTAKDDQLLASQVELLTLEPFEERVVTYTYAPAVEGEIYVTGVLQDGAVQELLNIVINRAGFSAFAVEVPALGLSMFPLKAGEPTTLFGCLSLLVDPAPESIVDVIITLTSKTGATIHRYEWTGNPIDVTNTLGETFTPDSDYRYATLSIEVSHYGDPVLSSSITYDCDSEGMNGCQATETEMTTTTTSTTSWQLIAFLVLAFILLVVVILVVIKVTSRNKPPTPLVPPSSTILNGLVLFFVLLGFSTFTPTAEAQSCTPPPVTSWDCWESNLHEGPYAPDDQFVCVPDGSSPYACIMIWGSYYQTETQTHNNVASIPSGYGACVNYCPATPPAASGNVSGTNCTIADGASTCNGTVNWTTSNAASPSVRNDTTGTQYSTAVSGNMAANLRYGSNSVVLRNSSTQLSSVNLSASCVAGTSWNGSVCIAPQAAFGNFEAATAASCSVGGWTFDPDSPATSIGIHIYRDGPAGSGTFVTSCTANGSRPDVNTAYGITGSHGFNCTLPASYATLGSRNLYVHAIDVNGTPNNTIGGSPRALNCAAPPATATISGSGCTIASGASTCNGLVTWSISNATTPNVFNATRNVQHSTAVSGTGSSIVLTNGANAIQARNSATVLNSTSLTASCVAGTSWNGSICAAPPAATATITGTNCSIPAGASSCSSQLTWSFSNTPTPNVRNITTNVQYSTSLTGSNVPVTITFGSHTVQARDNTTSLAQTIITASCTSGTSWNGGQCVATPPPQPLATATISINGCTIPENASMCAGSVTWNIQNAALPTARNNTLNTEISTNPSGTATLFMLPGPVQVSARDGSTVLATANYTAVCASGTSWNGTSCYAPIPPGMCGALQYGHQSPQNVSDVVLYQGGTAPNCQALCNASLGSPQTGDRYCNYSSHIVGMQWGFVVPDVGLSNGTLVYQCRLSQQTTYVNPFVWPYLSSWSASSCPAPTPMPTATISGIGCTIPAGQSTCNGALTWAITDATTPNVRNTTTGTQYSTNPTGSAAVVALTHGANTIAARDNTTVLRTTSLVASCAAGSTWTAGSCVPDIVPGVELKVDGQDTVTVNNGTPFTLTWTGTAVSNCLLFGAGWVGGQAVPATGSRVVTASVLSNYIINCTGGNDQVAVTVRAIPTATLLASVNGSAPSGADQTVNPSDTVRLSWTSDDASSCVGTNFNTSGATNNVGGVVVTLPTPGNNLDYEITCTGTGGSGGDSLTITNRSLPNIEQPQVIGTPNYSSTFDPVTGAYDYVIVNFSMRNGGGSSSLVPVTYRFEYDPGSGFVATPDGDVGVLTAGQTSSAAQRSISNVPFGIVPIRITADYGNTITESNETDNILPTTITIPPPPPNLELAVNPGLVVRPGDSVSILWDVNATYPMTCTVTGPAFTTVTFDPSTDGPTGSAPAGPITSQSNYTLTCTEPITNTTFPPEEIVVETVGSVEEI